MIFRHLERQSYEFGKYSLCLHKEKFVFLRRFWALYDWINSAMDKIKVRDLDFSVSIPEAKIMQRVAEVGRQIGDDLKDEHPLFLAVLNGAFMFAADLVRCVGMPCEISFIRVASYAGMQSTGEVSRIIGLKENIEGRTVVIVEDIIDSGTTMRELVGLLRRKNPKSIRIAALLVKPGNLKVDLKADYCCFEIPGDFIVGYGLDYDGEGRNLRDIYTVVRDEEDS